MITEMDKIKMIITEGAKKGMALSKFIDLQINDFKQSDTYNEMIEGSKYFKNEGDIENKKRTYINLDGVEEVAPHAKNYILKHPILYKMINQKAGYLLRKKPTIKQVIGKNEKEDEDYKEINGKWLNEEPYGVVHRVASTGIVRGAASFCLDWAYAQTLNLRMDTYSDNIPMQKLLEKCGFQYCGSFERLGMDKWMAYQKI